jgi:hypothetical protein
MLSRQPTAIGDEPPGSAVGVFGFIGQAAGIEYDNVAVADFDNIARQDFFLGDALAIDETAAGAVVIFEKVFGIFLNDLGVQWVYTVFVDD